jgi:peptide/nickel transport system permease protein
MVTFLVRRIAFMLVTVLGAVTVTFVLATMVPSDPARAALGPDATESQVAQYRRERGLDQPLPVQYVRYVGAIARGDFGTSIVSRTPILDDLARFIPATIELLVPSLLISIVFGVGLGMAAAFYRGTWIDQVSRFLSLVGLSMPIFWLGLVLQLVFFRALGWFPASGRLDSGFSPPPLASGLYTVDALLAGRWDLFWSAAHHLVLPAVALSTLTLGIVARMTRSSLLDVLSSNYVRTARSKGLQERRVLWKHALRNALIPIVTVIGLRLGQMFSGAVLTETVFAWPGVGRYAFTALRQLDFPVVIGFTVWATLVYAVVNLLVDLSYSWIDPRVRLE